MCPVSETGKYQSPAEISLIGLIDFAEIKEGSNLACEIVSCCIRQNVELADGDIAVVAQKVISKSEGMFKRLSETEPGEQALELAAKSGKDPRLVQIILNESNAVLRVKPGVIVTEHRLGMICANAGIDHSNVSADDDLVLTLPRDPDASAKQLAGELTKLTGKRLAAIATDSWGRPWRIGSVGFAIGVAGVPAIVDKIGEFDMFGRPLESTVIGLADQLAAAAAFVMGEGGERRPVVIIKGLPVFEGASSAKDLLRPAEADLFR